MLHKDYLTHLDTLSEHSKSDNYMSEGIATFLPFIDAHSATNGMTSFRSFLQTCSAQRSNQFISTGSLYCALRLIPFLPEGISELFSWKMDVRGVISLVADDTEAFIQMKSANVVVCSVGPKDDKDWYFTIKMTRDLRNTQYAKEALYDVMESVKQLCVVA